MNLNFLNLYYISIFYFIFVINMRKEKPLNLHLSNTEIEKMKLEIYEKCMKYNWTPSKMLENNSMTQEDLRSEIYTFLMHFYPICEWNNYEMYKRYTERKIKQTHLEIERWMKRKHKNTYLCEITEKNTPVHLDDVYDEKSEEEIKIKEYIRMYITENITEEMLNDIYTDILHWKVKRSVKINITYAELKENLKKIYEKKWKEERKI